MGFSFSQNSLDKMNKVHPNLIAFMKELIQITPYDFKILSGMRTAKEQAELYEQGRSKPGTIITNADGYKYCSNHQEKVDGYGYAVDIGVLVKENEKTVYKGSWKDFHYYETIYKTAEKAGLLEKYEIEWAGNWKSFREGAHFQIKNARNVAFKK
ncbi:M15 family metallopeptidase [Fusobacterium necrophorum]|uniref:M15 family metallopeptidase n=2 Tax=Fusobacterium necrophorum TaxID=859 RepID=UPI00254BE03F|nr:M15 family metallopeptidase [Fusobacterium necrophorum]MDK4494548.1 M15 family metallopeptidase [Fusobacterium necrophorum]MDK4504523.1 M15 family metallopeptidase [Fusobacterium necrophorum]